MYILLTKSGDKKGLKSDFQKKKQEKLTKWTSSNLDGAMLTMLWFQN